MHVVELTQKEADILEGLRAGIRQQDICKKYGYNKPFVSSKLHMFLARDWVVKFNGRNNYNVVLKDYVINNSLHRNANSELALKRAQQERFVVPHEIAVYLRANYHTTPRSKLEKHLGISRYLLNNYLIGMRLGS